MSKPPKVVVTFDSRWEIDRVEINGHTARRIASSCRKVYRHRDWVVKVAPGEITPYALKHSGAHPLNQNKREVKNYKKSIGKAWGKYLVPIVAWADDYRWLVMPYVKDDAAGIANILTKALKLNDHHGQMVTTPKGILCYDYGL